MKNWIATLVGGCIILILLGLNIHNKQDYKQLRTVLADTVNYYSAVTNNQGLQIATQHQRILNLKNAEAAGLVEKQELKDQHLKDVAAIVRLEKENKRLNLQINLDTPTVLTVTDTTEVLPEGTYLKVPASFLWSDEWAGLSGTITGPSIQVDSLWTHSKFSIYLGYQKQGFFKAAKPVVTVADKSPYGSTVRMENVIIQERPPFYQRPWFYRLEGAAILFGGQTLLNLK